jgi:nicotinamidase-related amidase
VADRETVLKPGNTALLAIDLQNEYRAKAAYPVEDYDGVLAKAAAVIAAARAAQVPVVHAQAWADGEAQRSYALLHDGIPEALRSAAPGSDGADICAEVAPMPGETVIRKPWPSAFRDTGLKEVLARSGIESLIAFGVWTDSCVRASVFDAVFAGYHVWLVKDACGSGTETMHRTAILDMANRLYGGGVLSAAEAIKALQAEPHRAWTCKRPVEFLYRVETLDLLYEAL